MKWFAKNKGFSNIILTPTAKFKKINLRLLEIFKRIFEKFLFHYRKVCGPAPDPEVCRILYAESLRAKYGEMTPEENAVHCSDLEEDGVLEVEYFFSLMQPYNPLHN